jgi:hypothetical protein
VQQKSRCFCLEFPKTNFFSTRDCHTTFDFCIISVPFSLRACHARLHKLHILQHKPHHPQVKPIDSFSMKWDAIRARVMSTDKKLRVGVVGGGAGGVELILSMQV